MLGFEFLTTEDQCAVEGCPWTEARIVVYSEDEEGGGSLTLPPLCREHEHEFVKAVGSSLFERGAQREAILGYLDYCKHTGRDPERFP